MIAFPAGVEIVVFHTPVRFGCGIDGMCRLCRSVLKREPMSRAYFLFINRAEEQIRILWYDGQGFLLATKRLSKGRFRHWPKASDSAESIVTFFEAQHFLSDGKMSEAQCRKVWKKIA
jgi:transposase